MRVLITLMVGVAAFLSAPSIGAAQVTPPPSAAPDVKCVPAGNMNSAAPGERSPGETMSDKLAQSKGVICPPGGDSEIRIPAPERGGSLRVIPPQVAPEPQK